MKVKRPGPGCAALAAVLLLGLFLMAGCSGEGKSGQMAAQESAPESTVTPFEKTLPEPSRRETIAPFTESEEVSEEENQSAKDGSHEGQSSGIIPFSPGDWDGELIIGTDIHYLAPELTDHGESFQYMVEHGDGKVVTYIDEITDAFLEEVIFRHPNALVLSGDLTLNGEKKSHQGLAKKLATVKDAGIPVLVVPGNHDINNHQAAGYEGSGRRPAEFTTPEEFRRIYRDFGYDEALSEDKRSLSYIYELDPKTWFLMLDTCQYSQKALVGGSIRSDTYDWIKEWLEKAWNEDIRVIAVAHHNLLDESEIYVDDCTIEHGEQLARILDEWEVPAFLSGHLHVQHAKRYHDEGVWEMVTASLATPDCLYGVMDYRGAEEFHYYTRSVDVGRWAREHDITNPDLLEFDAFKEPFLLRVFRNRALAELEDERELTDIQKDKMADFYAWLAYYYYQGTARDIRSEAFADPAYELWTEEAGDTELCEYLEYILSDAYRDYNEVWGD